VSNPARTLQEAELTPEEVERILRVCGTQALLVGGQSLAAWTVHYGIQPVDELSRTVTTDADFIGTSRVAEALQRTLGKPWKLRVASHDDIGEQVAKVYATLPGEGVKQIDFLAGIIGLKTADVKSRASEIALADGLRIRLLHPLDVLESRLRNLDALPSKRNPIGVAQARLAVKVVRGFIEDHMNSGGDPRVVRQALKRVEKLALDTRLAPVAFSYGIDVLDAVPVQRIAYPKFHEEQWPRTLARLERKREKFAALEVRRKQLKARREARTRSP
jgi:hypothetical protein